MMAFKSLVAVAAAVFLFQGTSARVVKKNGTPAGPFCTDFTPFVYAGCFTDPGPRALPFSSNISSDAMTTETCVSFCKGMDGRVPGYISSLTCGKAMVTAMLGTCNELHVFYSKYLMKPQTRILW
jgi:hypothetical protein